MDMEIVYYEQEGGVLQKVAEFVVQTRNGASLDELCREALKEVSQYMQCSNNNNIVLCRCMLE